MDVTCYAELEPFTTKDGSTIRELMHTQNQSLAEAVVGPGQSTERHYHARTEELYSFVEGGESSRSTASGARSRPGTPC